MRVSIYKACDIRGRFGETLQVAHAARLGAAIATLKNRPDVLVCGDGRISTPLLKSALVDALVQAGCRVVDVGIGPTPLFYFARAHLSLEVGVMVTASHNPAHDNGFKITLGPLPVTEKELRELASWMESGAQSAPAAPGACTRLDLLPEYLAALNAQGGHPPALAGVRVVVDCAHGMASLVARHIWQHSGAAVTLLLEEVDGRFPVHAPNPAELKNLALLQAAVLEHGADLGVAYDGDADRVVFVDERGQAVTGDQAIVLFARAALHPGFAPGSAGGLSPVVVYDQKCSRIVPETIQALGGQPVLERSGHTYIKRAFMERGAVYAGEMSGHHFLRAAGGDDALAASLWFARVLKESGQALSQVCASIPSYPITPDIRIPMEPAVVDQVLSALKAALAGEAIIREGDGLRLEFVDGWGLVRRSVTEPLITLRFEGREEAALQRILSRVEEVCPPLRGRLPGGIGSSR